MHRSFRAFTLVALLTVTAPSFASEAPAGSAAGGSAASQPGAAPAALPPIPAGAPTEAAVRELLAASEARNLLDATVGQMRSSLDATLDGAMRDPQLNDAQRRIVTEWKDEFIAVLTGYLDWAQLEPMFVDIYRRSFTREEVDALVAFYRTPAGRALISKMPAVMQNSMTAMQARMADLQPRMAKLQSDLQAKLQAAATQP